MIRNGLFIAILTLATVSVFAQKQNYSIAGVIKNIESDVVFLEQYVDGKFVRIDTSKVINGAFELKGSVTNGVNSAAISVPRVRGYATVFIEEGDIKLSADVNKLYLAEIKGGENSELLSRFYRSNLELEDVSMEYLDKYQAMNRMRNRDSASYYLSKHKEYLDKVEQNKQNFATESQKSAAGLYYYRAKLMSKITDFKAVNDFLAHYDKGFENNNDLQLIKKHASLLNEIREGGELVDITLPDPDGKRIKLSSLRGNYVLIDFWASWCAPCRNEAKNLALLYEKYKNENFEILGISIDSNEEHWKKAMAEDKTPWKHVLDKNSTYKNRFGITSIPRLMLIDDKGNVISNAIRGEALEKKLKEIFEK